MAYLGNDLQVAFPVYRNIDDISGSFNSVLKTFPLTVSGVAPVPAPLYSQQCLISVGGVVQRPDDSGLEGFRLSGSNIIFASAPTTGADFFGVILAGADYVNAGANFPSGTAAIPSITFDSDLDTGIYNSGPNQVSVTTSGTERLRIDSAGQIESVSLGTAATPAFSFTTDPNTGIYSPGADELAIGTGGNVRATVDASGRLLVGTATALPVRFGATVLTPQQQLIGGAVETSFLQGCASTTAVQSAIHWFAKYASGTAGNNATAVVNGETLGQIAWTGSDGSNQTLAATILCGVDGTPGVDDMPGRLVFSTTADGANLPTERMRIAQNGVITIQNGAVAVIGTLTDGATITPDFAADCNFTVTLGGSRTIANPTNITAGQSGSIFIVQDATGSRTLNWGSFWDFPGGTAPTLSTAANAVDRVDYIVRSSTSIHTVFTANYS